MDKSAGREGMGRYNAELAALMVKVGFIALALLPVFLMRQLAQAHAALPIIVTLWGAVLILAALLDRPPARPSAARKPRPVPRGENFSKRKRCA